MKKIFFSFLVASLFSSSLVSLHLKPVGLDSIKESVLPVSSSHIKLKFFTGDDSAQKLKMLETLKNEYKVFLDKEKQLSESLDKQVVVVKKEIDQVKSNYPYTTNEFIIKKINLLSRKYQVFLDIRESRQQIGDLFRQHIEYLDKYFQTTDLVQALEEKTIYSFADLQKLTRQVTIEKEVLSRLGVKKENEESVIARTESIFTAKDKELKNINETLDFLKKSSADVKNQMILLDLEKEAISFERELASLRIDEHVKRVNFIDSQIFVNQQKINQLDQHLVSIRSRMKVDKQDVILYQQKNNDLKKEIQAFRVELMKKRTELTNQKLTEQEDLEKLSDRYKVSLLNLAKIEEWEIVSDSINEGLAVFTVLLAETQVVLLEQKIDEIRLELLILDAKLAHGQTLEESIKSLYTITQTKLSDVDQLEKEKVHYKDIKNSIQNMIKIYQDRITELHSSMKLYHKKISNIKKDQEKFKLYHIEDAESEKKYNQGLAILTKALKLVEEQNENLIKLSERYTALIELKEETLVLSNFMLQELDLIGVWHRSNRAVTLEGFKQIIPNLITFAQNVYGILSDYVINFRLMSDAYEFFSAPTTSLISYLLFLFFLYILFVSLRTLLPVIYSGLLAISDDMQGLFLLSRIFAAVCGFLHTYIRSIYLWSLIFFGLSFYQLSIAFTLLFYIFSIVFLIYLSRNFLRYLLHFNRSIKYVLLGESFVERFVWIFSFFSTSTIFILFFRKMFMLVMMYQQSEFPIILIRLYHVVIFISVVFSIEKEELLNLIPKTNIYFQSLFDLIQNYYYILSLCCILVLILSDPYLGGYGHLIWFILLNSIMSILLCSTMYLVHSAVKTISSWIFFKEFGDFGLKERFEYAKTWYAIFVVFLFFITMIATAIFMAQIWGYPIAFGQIERFLHYAVFEIYTGSVGGKVEYLRVAGILRLIASVFVGFFTAFIFRRYVLQRVFDIQYVDPGVQDTVMMISRYAIIIMTIFIGFAHEGLGSYVLYVLAIGLLTFGWTFKDLFADVVAYFFILVQRPIKVGDYIKIDSELMGVVKKISPRAVILRRKNSVTIVVPNSIILKSPLYNWNYTRGYIAFDDIIFSVHFKVDPIAVKKMLQQIVTNHPDVLKVPEPIIRLDDFGDKGYTFMVRGYISSGNTLNQWVIASDVRLLIVASLRAQGIEVAEPILNVKINQ
jgi:small-conductance mechanosensitive channel